MTNNLETVAEREPSKPSKLASSLKHIFVPYYTIRQLEIKSDKNKSTSIAREVFLKASVDVIDMLRIAVYAAIPVYGLLYGVREIFGGSNI